GIRDDLVTGVQTCDLPIYRPARSSEGAVVPRTEAPRERPPASGPSGLRVAGIALGVVGVAGLTTGVVSSLEVRSLEREAETAKEVGGAAWGGRRAAWRGLA